MANDISLQKLQNQESKCFFEKYEKLILPDESKLRKNYAPLCYEDVLLKILKEVGKGFFWVLIGETTDVKSRHVACVTIDSSENST